MANTRLCLYLTRLYLFTHFQETTYILVFTATLINNSNMISVIPFICFYCQARSEKILLLYTDKASVHLSMQSHLSYIPPMMVPVLRVLKSHSGASQNSVRYAMCLGFFPKTGSFGQDSLYMKL